MSWSWLRRAALIAVICLLALVAVHVVVPQRSGTIALTEVFEPYLLLLGLVAGALAFGAEMRVARPIVAVFLVVALARCGPVAISGPAAAAGTSIQVATWNLAIGQGSADRALAGIHGSEAVLIALQELQPDAATAIEADAELSARLPYRMLAPQQSTLGMGVLSAYPILQHEQHTDPPFIRALVDAGVRQPIAVFAVHPLPAAIGTFARIPVSLETTRRDAAIAQIRARIDEDLAAGRPVIVLGDINATEREPAYAEFSAGLRDAHLDAGFGPGFTWRPARLAFLPFGLLRIDYVFASPLFTIDSTFVDCSLPSDHCRLEAGIQIGPDFEP